MNDGAVPIVGGTGALGLGLALRFASAGTRVVIGSRDPGRAAAAAEQVRERVPGAAVDGAANPEAVARIPGLRPVDCGSLEVARLIEGLTPFLISVNRRNKTHAGIRLAGLEEPRW